MPPDTSKPSGLSLLLNWRRVRFTLIFSVLIALPLAVGWKSGLLSLVLRTVLLGLAAMLVFGLFEQWPRRLPSWLARWVLQVISVAMVMPVATYLIYTLSTAPGAPPFWSDPERLTGFLCLIVVGVLLAPWVALGALVRQKDALARHQALAFKLERSELERQALDARMRVLRAQVEPHFLFNTLANVRELVDGGLGTGLKTLRERLQLVFGDDARLRLTPVTPHGVCAELDFIATEIEP